MSLEFMSELTPIQKVLLDIPKNAKVEGLELTEFKKVCRQALMGPFDRKELERLALTSMTALPLVGTAGFATHLLAASYATAAVPAAIVAATVATMSSLFYTGVRSVNAKNHNKVKKSPQGLQTIEKM
jgi:hypothetical protein